MNKFIKISLILGLLTTLFGCDLFFRKKHKQEVMPASAAISNHSMPELSNEPWELNEGHLVTAGDLLMQQQREIGHSVDLSQKRAYLSHHMNISVDQANEILEELGIE